jgi:hypothetical protein
MTATQDLPALGPIARYEQSIIDRITDFNDPRRGVSLADRLAAPFVHPDGGAKGLQRVLKKCEVVGAPEQRTTLDHHSLDHCTSWATVTKVSSGQGPGGFLA